MSPTLFIECRGHFIMSFTHNDKSPGHNDGSKSLNIMSPTHNDRSPGHNDGSESLNIMSSTLNFMSPGHNDGSPEDVELLNR